MKSFTRLDFDKRRAGWAQNNWQRSTNAFVYIQSTWLEGLWTGRWGTVGANCHWGGEVHSQIRARQQTRRAPTLWELPIKLHKIKLGFDLLWYMIFTDCSWVSTRWQWSVNLYKNRKETSQKEKQYTKDTKTTQKTQSTKQKKKKRKQK